MSEGKRGIVGRIKQIGTQARISADKEATIGSLTIIYWIYKDAGNIEVPELCQKLGKMIRATTEKDYTPEMMQLATEIQEKIQRSPGNLRLRLARKMEKIMKPGFKPKEEDIDEILRN